MEQAIESTTETTLNRHDVHLYVVTRVKVCNVMAPNPVEAAKLAEEMALDELHTVLDRTVMQGLKNGAYVMCTEYAEDGSEYFLVDPYDLEATDEVNYDKCVWLNRMYRPMTEAVSRGEAISINYDKLHAFAAKHRISYNEMCAAMRDAINGLADQNAAPSEKEGL